MCCNPNKTYEYPKIQEKLREDLQQHDLVKRRVERSEVAQEVAANTDMKKHSVAPENSLVAGTVLAGFVTAGLESVDLASVALVDMTLADSVLPDMNLAGKEQHPAAGMNTPCLPIGSLIRILLPNRNLLTSWLSILPLSRLPRKSFARG